MAWNLFDYTRCAVSLRNCENRNKDFWVFLVVVALATLVMYLTVERKANNFIAAKVKNTIEGSM